MLSHSPEINTSNTFPKSLKGGSQCEALTEVTIHLPCQLQRLLSRKMAAQQALQCCGMEGSADKRMLKHARLVQHSMSLTVYLREYLFSVPSACLAIALRRRVTLAKRVVKQSLNGSSEAGERISIYLTICSRSF